MDQLIIPRLVYDEIIQHAQAVLPLEAVGLLGGEQDGRIGLAVPLVNVAVPGMFFADPYAQYQAQKKIKESGLCLLAVYHSHPAGGTKPSLVDLEYASLLGLVQVIVALARPDQPGVDFRGYRVIGGRIIDVPLVVDTG